MGSGKQTESENESRDAEDGSDAYSMGERVPPQDSLREDPDDIEKDARDIMAAIEEAENSTEKESKEEVDKSATAQGEGKKDEGEKVKDGNEIKEDENKGGS